MIFDRNALFGSQLLVSIFAQYDEPFSFNKENLVNILYQKSKEERYSHLFANYPFDDDPIIVSSPSLDEGIDTLYHGEIINLDSFNYSTYNVNIELIKKIYNNFIEKKVDGKMEKLLKDLALEVRGKLS